MAFFRTLQITKDKVKTCHKILTTNCDKHPQVELTKYNNMLNPGDLSCKTS
jgi:hypothetical protein